jgi:LEA14-like dessication related protein
MTLRLAIYASQDEAQIKYAINHDLHELGAFYSITIHFVNQTFVPNFIESL